MELIIISSKKSSPQAIALPGGQEIQVPQPVAFASPKANNAHSCASSRCPTKSKYASIIFCHTVCLHLLFLLFSLFNFAVVLVSWLQSRNCFAATFCFLTGCRAFISSRGSISLNLFAPCFICQCVLWLQSRSCFTTIFVP